MDFNNHTVERYSEAVYTLTATAGGTTTLAVMDGTNPGNVFNVTFGAGNTTFAFTNPGTSGVAVSFTLMLKQDGIGSRTATWPGTVVWSGGTTPTLTTTASKTDMFTFFTVNNGTTWFGFTAGLNF